MECDMKCILCGSDKINKIDMIKKDDLIILYKKSFGIDIENIIKEFFDKYPNGIVLFG